jgi:Predicted UDP-glucose 6-dehydrogenase
VAAALELVDPPGCRNSIENALDAVTGADAMVVLTEWNEFRALNLEEAKRLMRGDVIVDLRNVFRPEMAVEAGFRYSGVGRPDAGKRLKLVKDTAA